MGIQMGPDEHCLDQNPGYPGPLVIPPVGVRRFSSVKLADDRSCRDLKSSHASEKSTDVRDTAKITVNMLVGIPIALRMIPE